MIPAINLQIDDREVVALLNKLAAKSQDLKPAMVEIGGLMHKSVIRNFEAEGRAGAIGGWRGGNSKWEPLKSRTLLSRNTKYSGGGGVFETRRKIKTGILQVSGRLRNSISFRADGQSAVVGTNVIYAAIQHFGGETKPHVIVPRHKKALAWAGGASPVKKVNHPGSKIPARPFLVIQDEDLTQIIEVLKRHLIGGLS